jgi:hypothetical protein
MSSDRPSEPYVMDSFSFQIAADVHKSDVNDPSGSPKGLSTADLALADITKATFEKDALLTN